MIINVYIAIGAKKDTYWAKTFGVWCMCVRHDWEPQEQCRLNFVAFRLPPVILHQLELLLISADWVPKEQSTLIGQHFCPLTVAILDTCTCFCFGLSLCWSLFTEYHKHSAINIFWPLTVPVLVQLNLLLLEPVLIIADQAGADDQVERNADKGSQTNGCLSEHQLVKAC